MKNSIRTNNRKGQTPMRTTILLRCAIVFCAMLTLSNVTNAQNPERLKRAESFFGIHFDFHAGPDCTEVGKNTTPEMIHTIIDLVKPDYLQTDCKGHAGYTSYPTKVGNQVPGYVGDPLRVWRDVTAARGVGLYMHYSGVWDSRAIELNPDWAAIDGAGNPNPNMTSVFGPYVDKLLIPQLKELAGDYGVDGIWVDGECWATMPDYGDRAQKLFRETTGIETIPRGPGDAHWFEWMQFHREAFRSYMRHYAAEVRSEFPEFQICSNWAFTDHMPEPVSVAVDFLSGDYSPNDSVNSARYSGRFLVHQGVPWDLMAWSFSYPSPRQQKTAVQLQREAAVVLALGGGFQAYFTQNRDGSVRLGEMEVMAEVAQFARERQPYCHHSIQIPQVAVLYSVDAYQRNAPGLFARYGDNEKLRGVLQCLLELQYSVDVVTEHTLGRNMERFPMIVVPEWNYLQPTFRDDLVRYVENGGKLFVIGEETKKLIGEAFFGQDTNLLDFPMPVMKKHGQGEVAILSQAIGQEYAKSGNEGAVLPVIGNIRDTVADIANKLFPEPKVEVTGSQWVDVSVSKLGDKLTVHLVNTSGNHRDTPIIDAIEPVGPLQITIRCDAKPQRITLQPEGKNCDFDYADGKATLTVDSVPIYSILVVE